MCEVAKWDDPLYLGWLLNYPVAHTVLIEKRGGTGGPVSLLHYQSRVDRRILWNFHTVPQLQRLALCDVDPTRAFAEVVHVFPESGTETIYLDGFLQTRGGDITFSIQAPPQ